jgi:hypothetical protein
LDRSCFHLWCLLHLECFSHVIVCPWAKRSFALPLTSAVTADAGVESIIVFGTRAVSIAVAMPVGIANLRMFRVHLPPALAIGLFPQVIADVDWQFMYGATIGTVTLSDVFYWHAHVPLKR